MASSEASKGAEMELQFDSTRDFECDMEGLPATERLTVIASINRHATATEASLVQLYPIVLRDHLEASLHVLKAARHLSVILTIDEDPVFDTKIVTLFRVVRDQERDACFASIAELLYHEFFACAT